VATAYCKKDGYTYCSWSSICPSDLKVREGCVYVSQYVIDIKIIFVMYLPPYITNDFFFDNLLEILFFWLEVIEIRGNYEKKNKQCR